MLGERDWRSAVLQTNYQRDSLDEGRFPWIESEDWKDSFRNHQPRGWLSGLELDFGYGTV